MERRCERCEAAKADGLLADTQAALEDLMASAERLLEALKLEAVTGQPSVTFQQLRRLDLVKAIARADAALHFRPVSLGELVRRHFGRDELPDSACGEEVTAAATISAAG